MRYIELFAGIGGFRYGLEKANDTVTERTQQRIQQGSKSNHTTIKSFLGTKQFTCVYANEWNKYACQIYRKNYGKKELYEGDITRISAKSIPNFDMLTAGFPCQRFSIAGKRKGMSGKDSSGFEFFEVYRIAKERHPRLLLLENVPGLFSSRGGKDFYTILKSLDEIGYDVEWDCNNTSVFLPQNRLRVFVVGHLRGTGGQKVFPIGEGYQEVNELCGQQTGAITARRRSAKSDGDYIIEGNRKALQQITKNQSQGYRIYNSEGISATLQSLAGGVGAKTGLYMNTLTEATGNRAGSSKEFLRSVNNINSAIGQVRRLTPTECERLQGFPDGWTEGISDSQRYKCLGNAVTTNVVEEIGKKILRVMLCSHSQIENIK